MQWSNRFISMVAYHLDCVLHQALSLTLWQICCHGLQCKRNMLDPSLLGKKSATKEILSLIGLLQHATRVVRCGRTFVAWMCATAAKVNELHFFT